MKRSQLISAAVFTVATGLASSAAFAHDGDKQTTAEHNRDLAMASQAVEQSGFASIQARPEQRDLKPLVRSYVPTPFELNVPGNPAFGRIASQ